MTLALQILAGLTVPFAASYAVARILGAFIDAGMHPRRGQGDQERASDVNAELNGGRLPAGMIGQTHNGSNLTTREQNLG